MHSPTAWKPYNMADTGIPVNISKASFHHLLKSEFMVKSRYFIIGHKWFHALV